MLLLLVLSYLFLSCFILFFRAIHRLIFGCTYLKKKHMNQFFVVFSGIESPVQSQLRGGQALVKPSGASCSLKLTKPLYFTTGS
jgi:hypothetical protein